MGAWRTPSGKSVARCGRLSRLRPRMAPSRRPCSSADRRSAEVTTTRLAATSSDARKRTASTASGTTAPLATTVTTGASAGQVGRQLARLQQPVATGQHLPPPLGLAQPRAHRIGQRLVDAACGEPQVRAEAGLPVEAAADALQQRPRRLDAERRFEGTQARQLDAQRGRHARLVRATLRRQRHARGRGHEDELRAHVQGVDEGVEAAGDERVIDRADGHQRLAQQLGRQARLAQPHEEVHLADAQLDVLTLG